MNIKLFMMMGLVVYCVPSFGMDDKYGGLGVCWRSQGSYRLPSKQEERDFERISREQKKILEEWMLQVRRKPNISLKEEDTTEDATTEMSFMEEQLSRLEREPVFINHYENYKAARKAMKTLHRAHFCPKIKLLEWKNKK